MSGPRRAKKAKKSRSARCVGFDGTNDKVSISDYTISASGTGDFSISLWFKTSNTTAITDTPFFAKEVGRFEYWFFFIDGVRKVKFLARDSSGFILNYESEAQSNDLAGEWNHLVYVCDRDAGQTVYINGAAITALTDTITDTTTSINNTADLTMGQKGSNHLFGRIAEFCTFSKALSASEVSLLYRKKCKYNLLRSKFNSNLTCWLKMGDGTEVGSGATIYDMSANSNNGTINGAVYVADIPAGPGS